MIMKSYRSLAVICLAGWLLFFLLSGLVAHRLCSKLILHLQKPASIGWDQILIERKKSLSSRSWHDPRPLFIFLGDSHIEGGDWYQLFNGALAIRNAGLSRAKIEDTAEIASVIPLPPPKGVLVMCGINNLGNFESTDSCLRKYASLLDTLQIKIRPQFIFVLSVLPVRESSADPSRHLLNLEVAKFNQALEDLCHRRRITFLQLNSAVTLPDHGLSPECTADGLHLNTVGYLKLAARLLRSVAQPLAEP
jgi:lysophospholipase L1-like esterase